MWQSGNLVTDRQSRPFPFAPPVPPGYNPPSFPRPPRDPGAMPSDSVAGFLDHAKANRVLGPEQVDQLMRQPDLPQDDLTALCDYLQRRGTLTRFQVELIRDRRGE